MLTTTSALCGSPPKKNTHKKTLPLPPNNNYYHHPLFSQPDTHSLPIIPRLFARGFPLFLFYLCTHSMTPVPPVPCCLTYPSTHPPTHSFSPPFLFPPTVHIVSYPCLCSLRKTSFFFPPLSFPVSMSRKISKTDL